MRKSQGILRWKNNNDNRGSRIKRVCELRLVYLLEGLEREEGIIPTIINLLDLLPGFGTDRHNP
jgi:hypothetical protein